MVLIKKFVAVILIALLVLNLIFVVLGKINFGVFWVLIIVIVILSYLMKKYL